MNHEPRTGTWNTNPEPGTWNVELQMLCGSGSQACERGRPDIGMRGDLQHRLHGDQPSRVARRRDGKCLVNDSCSIGVLTGTRERDGVSECSIN